MDAAQVREGIPKGVSTLGGDSSSHVPGYVVKACIASALRKLEAQRKCLEDDMDTARSLFLWAISAEDFHST